MRRWFARALVVAGVLCAAASERPPLRAQGRAADTLIPAAFAIPLTSPSVPDITLSTIERVLVAAKVPFGIEGGAPQDPPLIDLAHPPTEVANLHAMTVGAALDTVARVDPSVRWSEDDGVIVVRQTSAPTWLDGALPPFQVSNANVSSALDALMTAVDPTRAGQVKPWMTFVLASPTGQMVRVGAELPRFSVVRDHGTVLDGLDAIVRVAHGAWRVEYAGTTLDAKNASVQISDESRFATGGGGTYAAESAVAVEARTHRNPDLVTVGLSQDLPGAVLMYAQAARVTVGLEALPPPQDFHSPTGVVLQLDRTQPQAALKQLVAYDSRYELTDDHGVFHVRPHGDPVIPGYAAPVTSFSASNEPLGDVMGRLTALAGAVEARPGMPPAISVISRGRGGQAEMAKQEREVPLTPVSLDFAGPGTIRDVLDALCRDRGLSWQVRATPQGGAFASSSLTLSSVDGWSISRRAIMPALRPGVRPVPVPPGTVALPSTPETLFEALPMADLRLRFGAYIRETAHTPGERAAAAAAAEQAPRITLQDLRISDLLTKLLQQVPGYAWTEDRSVYHIQPLALGTSPDEPINRPVDRLDVQLTDLGHAARVAVGLMTGRPAGPGEVPGWFTTSGPPNVVHPLGGPMHLVLDHGTVRDALDAILRTGQAQSWTLVSSSDGLHRSITLRLCAPLGRNCGSESTQDPGPR